jgi:hypothetical protein
MVRKWNIIGCLVCGFIVSCNAQTQKDTPEYYKNKSHTKPEVYQKITFKVIDSIKNKILNKEDPYYPPENDSLTEIFVDTLLFSPSMNKIAFFVITENSNDKLLDKGNKNQFHYSSYCFIGHLDSSYNIKDFKWVSGGSLFNFKSKINASNRIRDIYFKEITNRTNSKGESTYKYNFDDVRFWNGPLWSKYY